MNVGCVPVDECVIQLEFKHKVAQAILDGGAGFISTIGARCQNAQGIGSASIHGVADGGDGGSDAGGKGELLAFGWKHQRVASRLDALSGSA